MNHQKDENMDIYTHTYPTPDRSVVALGFFDGVHRGHAALLNALNGASLQYGVPAFVYTFSSHPAETVSPGTKMSYLSSKEEKTLLFENAGADGVVFEDFDKVKDLSPEEFVSKILVGVFHACRVICGFNFHFGKDGEGDADLLHLLMKREGGEVTVIPPVCVGDMLVSSAAIRHALEEGDTEKASLLLGRRYSLTGVVVAGAGKGHLLGFPTVNLLPPASLQLPRDGVYAAETLLDGKEYPSVTNVGVKPTMTEGKERTVETHLIGYAGDAYGKTVSVSFGERLRDEKQFDSPEALIQQIHKDIAFVKKKSGKEKE